MLLTKLIKTKNKTKDKIYKNRLLDDSNYNLI